MASSATVIPLGASLSCVFSGFSRPPHLQISTCSRTPRKFQVRASGNSFGKIFRVTTFGESRGGGVGCIVDGCPPRLDLSEADIQRDLDRRRPDLSGNITYRKETDICKIYSGVADGMTTGTPIMISVPNNDQKGHRREVVYAGSNEKVKLQDYDEMNLAYRPSHADATYDFKYGVRSVEGGGRSAARETIGRVAAGAIAKKLLQKVAGIEVLGYVSKVHDVVLPEELVDYESLTFDQIENSIVRCPNPEYAEKMNAVIDAVHAEGDSIGGVVTCIVRNCPRGLGSPVFDKLEALLAQALMSIPASKAFEVGSGFAGTNLTGSQHNDEFFMDRSGRIRTRTNRSGGIQGGISNGEIITIRVAFKPTATIAMKQNTVTRDKREVVLSARVLHDPCILPRAVPVVESMVALVLVDQLMVQCAQGYLLGINPELQDPVPVHNNALTDFKITNVE